MYVKNTILVLLLTGIGAAAFRLSFGAQVTLALAAGVPEDQAWLYPAVVDAAIVIAVLIDAWNRNLTRWQRIYVWTAITLWTITSILGNAFHVSALKPGIVTVDQVIAIAVNTVPAITLFLVIHLAITIAFHRPTPPKKTRTPAVPKPAPATPATSRPRAARSTGIPANAAELAAMHDNGLSYAEIAARTGRSKSYIGETVKQYRDQKGAA